jgi:TonB family protein
MLLVLVLCAAAQQPRRIRVGGNVQQARLTKRVNPEYPPLAREARIQGTVRLQAIIGYDGTITQLEVVSGHPLLAQASLDAVRQWQYQTTLLNGEPIEVETTIDVVFTLEEDPVPDGQDPAAAEHQQALKKITTLMQGGRFEDAVTELRAVVERKPEDIEARAQLAMLLAALGRPSEGIAELREALRYTPDNLELRTQLFEMLLEADQVHEAISEFHEMRRYGDPPAHAIGQMGAALYRTQRPESAEAEFKLLAQSHPKPAEAYAAMAQELATAGRMEAALRLIMEGERLAPNDRHWKDMRAQFEQIQDFIERGMELVRARIQQNPRQPAARLLMALGYLLHEEWESKGRDEMFAAFELGFDEYEGHMALAEVMKRRLGRNAFIAELRGWVRRFPRLPNLHLVLAETIWESGDHAGAITELRNAIAAAPQNAELRTKLAGYLDQLGDKSSATAEREMAKSLPAAAASASGNSLRELAEELAKSILGEDVHRSSEEAAEAAAIGSVRVLNTANVQYASTYGVGFAPALANLGPMPEGAEPSAQYADLIDAVLASGAKSGYIFTYIVTSTDEKGQPAAYEIYADPVQPGTTGNRFFYTDQSGIVRVSTGGRAGPASPPIA